MTLKTRDSPINFPDSRQLGLKQADRHTGWKFPITQAWKAIFSKQKMNTEFQAIASAQTHNNMFPLIVAMVNNLDDCALFCLALPFIQHV